MYDVHEVSGFPQLLPEGRQSVNKEAPKVRRSNLDECCQDEFAKECPRERHWSVEVG